MHVKDFFISVDHVVVVYAFLSKFVENEGVALAVPFGENLIKQRRFAGAEETGEHDNWDLWNLIHRCALQAFGVYARLSLQRPPI